MNCIVLEHCGKHIPGFKYLTFKQRYNTILLMTALLDTSDNRLEIFDLIIELHRHGYHHFDLIKENVYFRDRRFRLIDLEDAHQHIDLSGRRTTCTWKGDSRKIKLGTYFPLDDLS